MNTQPRRTVVSTHLLRLTARRAQRHYERLQQRALHKDAAAQHELDGLHIGKSQDLDVERAYHERAKWRVVAL